MGKKAEVDNKIILVDADVIIHFFKASEILRLINIFPNRLRILDVVYDELTTKKASYKKEIDNLLNMCKSIKVIPFPSDGAILREYSYLLNTGKGEGECACMALAKHSGVAIASSNIKDIATYCQMHQIEYYTTMDLLYEGYRKGIMTELECDYFISAVRGNGSKLPCNKMSEYLKMIKDGHRSDLYSYKLYSQGS